MQYRKLGTTDISVSLICLGTMTWGEQNTEADAHAQMDYATGEGVNFFDAAEMYPVPPRAETQGATERFIGSWLKARGKRDKVILATKVVGPDEGFKHVRGEMPRLNKDHIHRALDASLMRLQTDYIDLYQLHWPERTTNYFGQLGYRHVDNEDTVSLEESLHVLHEIVRSGKVRAIGISNETPWGMMTFLKLSETKKYTRIVSIQNPYNLLNRSFEVGLAECSMREGCRLLAYSPMAFGMLSGKYIGGTRPPKSRLTLFSRFQRYTNPLGQAATERYVELARRYELSPAQMSLAFINQKPFVTSTIIGATTLEQLKENIDSVNVKLSDEVLAEIDAIHQDIPNPCP
ncbi:MAG: NADP(H)-dependent aldo-keto reductase [Rickettsiales bacterium]